VGRRIPMKTLALFSIFAAVVSTGFSQTTI
jgi:hypothetical protein